MGNPIATAPAAVLDVRELPELAFRGPQYLEEWISAVKQTCRPEQPVNGRDFFAFHGGPLEAREPLLGPAFSHHCVMLVQAPADMDVNIGGCRAQRTGGPGTACLIPAGCESQWRAAKGYAESINLFLSPWVLNQVAVETLEVIPQRALLHPGLPFEESFLVRVGSVVERMTKSDDLFDRLYLESLAHTTAMHLLEHYADFPVTPRPVKGRLPLAVLRQVSDYVEQQPDSELTLAKLASLAHLSPYHFARLFKETTGQTVHAFVREQRLLRACHLLLATRLTIGYIALETGFADESHFVRNFKAQFGVTPGVVRRSLLQ